MAELESLQEEAQLAAERGDFEAAVAGFREAVEHDIAARRPALHEQLAQCLAELGRYDEALSAASICVQAAPDWAPGWLTQARIELNQGSLGRALSCYSKCLELGGAAETPELLAEVREAEALWEQQVARRVGQPQLRIAQQLGSGAGPGAVVWECGLCLAEFLTKHLARWLIGKRLLELGSGTGVAGLTAAALGARVLLTDRAEALPLLRANAARNGDSAEVAALEWDAPQPAPPLRGRAFHGLLLADPVYSAAQVPGLLAVLRAVLGANPGVRLLLAHKHRHEAVDSALFAGLEGLLGGRLRPVAASSADARVRVYDSRAGGLGLAGQAMALPQPDAACAGHACN